MITYAQNLLHQIYNALVGVGSCGQAKILGNFPCQGILLIWIIVGQGPTVLEGED